MARHQLDLLEPRATLAEVAVGFTAALSVGVAGTFASDNSVPKWLVVLLFVAGLVLWLAAAVWLASALRHLALIAAGRSVKQRPLGVTWAGWAYSGFSATALVLVASASVFALGIRSDPDFASPYDAQDPNAADCVDAAVVAVDGGSPAIRDLAGRSVGHLELRASPKCGTIWAKAVLDPRAAETLRGQVLTLVMVRPKDDVRASYPLRLKGGTEGFSNMLSGVATCVRAEASLGQGRKNAPVAVTRCVREDA